MPSCHSPKLLRPTMIVTKHGGILITYTPNMNTNIGSIFLVTQTRAKELLCYATERCQQSKRVHPHHHQAGRRPHQSRPQDHDDDRGPTTAHHYYPFASFPPPLPPTTPPPMLTSDLAPFWYNEIEKSTNKQ